MNGRIHSAASERPLPPLPKPSTNFAACEFSAAQMRAYVLADRAASAPQAVRMLTEQEFVDAMHTDYGPAALSRVQALQYKFCEINGLSLAMGAAPGIDSSAPCEAAKPSSSSGQDEQTKEAA